MLTPLAWGQHVLLDTHLNIWTDELAKPLLAAADLSSTDVGFGILVDDDINAFAIPGRQIYVHTGLLIQAKDVSVVRGVLAHEIGHVLAHHHFERHQDLAKVKFGTIAGAVAGLGAALAGAGGAAAGLVLGGTSAGIGNLLHNSRTQEREADRIAITLLERNNCSAEGLVDFFQYLNTQQQLTSRKPPAHLLTHPLTPERLNSLKAEVAQEQGRIKYTDKEQYEFELIQAKVFALTHSAASTRRKYRGESDADKLAQTIAFAKGAEFDRALRLLQTLPETYWSVDLAGQIAMEQGAFENAVAAFQAVLRYHPKDPVAQFNLARAYQAAQEHKFALPVLRQLTLTQPEWAYAWYLRGISAGQENMLVESHLSLAENALIRGDIKTAQQHLRLAEKAADEKDEDQQRLLQHLRDRLDALRTGQG